MLCGHIGGLGFPPAMVPAAALSVRCLWRSSFLPTTCITAYTCRSRLYSRASLAADTRTPLKVLFRW